MDTQWMKDQAKIQIGLEEASRGLRETVYALREVIGDTSIVLSLGELYREFRNFSNRLREANAECSKQLIADAGASMVNGLRFALTLGDLETKHAEELQQAGRTGGEI